MHKRNRIPKEYEEVICPRCGRSHLISKAQTLGDPTICANCHRAEHRRKWPREVNV